MRHSAFDQVVRALAVVAVFILGIGASESLAQAPTNQTATRPDAKQTDILELKPGELIERALTAGQSHSYKIPLVSGQYLTVSVNQFDVNAEVALTNPNGVEIFNRDWWWREGMESAWALAEVTGDYILKISSPKQPPDNGGYRLRFEQGRFENASTPVKDSVSAHRLFAEAEVLVRTVTAESSAKATEKYQEALRLWRANKDRDAAAHALNGLGVISWRSGNLKQATVYLDEAVQLFTEMRNRRGAVNSLTTLSNAYNFAGDTRRALEAYDRALPLAREIKDYRNEAGIMAGMGLMLQRVGQTEKALATLQELVSITRRNGYVDGEAVAHNNIGLIHVSQGRLREAIGEYRQTLALLEISGDRFGQSFALNNIGNAHARMAEFQLALDFLLRALDLKRLVGDRRGEAAAVGSVGNLYLKMGDLEKSLQYYDQSLALSRAVAAREFEAAAVSNLGLIHARRADFQKALDYSIQALALRKQLADRNGEAYDLTTLGWIHARLGDFQKAISHNEEALVIRRSVGDKYGEAQTLASLGTIYARLGDNAKALASLTESLSLTKSTGDRLGEAGALFELAKIERARGLPNEARANVKAAIEIVESTRSKVFLSDVRSTYFASRQDYYDFYIDLLMQTSPSSSSERLAESFSVNEQRRARNLLDSLAESGANIRGGAPPELIQRERRLQQELNAKADQQVRLISRKHTPEQAAALSTEIATLTTEYEQTLAQIRLASPGYAALTQTSPLGLKAVQSELLDSESVLLEFSLGEERSYLWLVTRSSAQSVELPKRADIETAARKVHSLLTARNELVKFEEPAVRAARVAKTDREYLTAARELSSMLLGKVASQIKGKRLIVVGDGILEYIPFAALPVTSRAIAYRPLLTEHEIVTLPSASVLAILRKESAGRRRAPKLLAVFADPVFQTSDPRVKRGLKNGAQGPDLSGNSGNTVPVETSLQRSAREVGNLTFERLPHTRLEASGIAALTDGTDSKELLDFNASRTTATSSEIADYRILHFATHGFINSRHPELSGIVLSLVDEDGRAQDGFLRVHEIYNLRLHADLVVLSACRTALGKEIRGEGLVGVTRGFMYAGAPRVIASLWAVEDAATAELMKRFYQEMLARKQRPAAALRTAQLSLWKEKRLPPYYWAGFVLQGEWK